MREGQGGGSVEGAGHAMAVAKLSIPIIQAQIDR